MSRFGQRHPLMMGGTVVPPIIIIIITGLVATTTIPQRPSLTRGTPPIDARLTAYLDQSWSWDGGGGGFGSARNLADQPSLYRTAWMLELARVLQVVPQHFDSDQAALWLNEVLANPMASEELPPLETVALATQALITLGHRPAPGAVAAVVDTLRAGSQYRWSADVPLDWTATARAVGVLRSVGAHIPDEVRVNALVALAGVTDSVFTPEQYVNTVLPVFATASALSTDEDIRPFRDAMEIQLQRLVNNVSVAGTFGDLAVLS